MTKQKLEGGKFISDKLCLPALSSFGYYPAFLPSDPSPFPNRDTNTQTHRHRFIDPAYGKTSSQSLCFLFVLWPSFYNGTVSRSRSSFLPPKGFFCPRPLGFDFSVMSQKK